MRDEDAHAAYVPTPKPEPEADLFSLLDSDGLLAESTAPTDEERVIALERDLLRDDVRADPAAVAALLHPDWMEVGRSGRLWDREEMLASDRAADRAGHARRDLGEPDRR